MICDFCSDEKPVWRLRCPSFEIADAKAVSQGDWLACEDCATLIVTERWRELAVRAAEKTSTGRVMVSTVGKERTVKEVMQMHQGFRKHFSGKVQRIT